MSDSFLSQSAITQLSDEQLQQELSAHGLAPGPIVGSTRRLYQKKLAAFLGYDVPDSQYSEVVEESEEINITQSSTGSPKKSIKIQKRKTVSPSTSKGITHQRIVSPDEQHSLSFNRDLHAPSPRLPLRTGRSALSESFHSNSFETSLHEGESVNNSWTRTLVKLIIIAILVAIVAFVYQSYSNEDPLKSLQKLARQMMDGSPVKKS